MEGLVLEKNNREGFFCKRAREGRDSLRNRKKGRGPRANLPSSSSFRLGNRGGGGRAPAAAMEEGDSTRGPWGFDSPAHPRLGRREAAWP